MLLYNYKSPKHLLPLCYSSMGALMELTSNSNYSPHYITILWRMPMDVVKGKMLKMTLTCSAPFTHRIQLKVLLRSAWQEHRNQLDQNIWKRSHWYYEVKGDSRMTRNKKGSDLKTVLTPNDSLSHTDGNQTGVLLFVFSVLKLFFVNTFVLLSSYSDKSVIYFS